MDHRSESMPDFADAIVGRSRGSISGPTAPNPRIRVESALRLPDSFERFDGPATPGGLGALRGSNRECRRANAAMMR
jgi:hypothetical protein